jgi:hypothetical protein
MSGWQELRGKAGRIARKASPGLMARRDRRAEAKTTGTVSGPEMDDLRRRVTELEAEVQECRRLHSRLAELTDVVELLLLPMSRGDSEKVEKILHDAGTRL